MKKLVVVLLLLPLGLFSQDRDSVRFVVGGVTCSMCSRAVQNEVLRDSSILVLSPNLEQQVWYAEYAAGKFDLNSLERRVRDAGFSLERVTVNGKRVYQRKRTDRRRERAWKRRLVKDLGKK